MVDGGVLGATISDTHTWSPQFMSDPMISAAGDGVAQALWWAVQLAAWAAVRRDEIAGADSSQMTA